MASPPQRPTNCPPICFNTCVSYCPTDCCNNPQQGVSRNTLSYTLKLPCPTNCYPTCHGNCPQQCCKAAQKGTSSLLHSAVNNKGVGFYQRIQGEGISPSMSLQTPSASPIVIRSTLLCPKVCNKICTNACPTECCKRQKNGNINQQKWRNTAQGKQHFVFWKTPPPPPNLREVTMITQLGEGINYVHEREEITVFVLPASGFLMAVRDFVSGNYE